eukprot:CAMPEP_0177628320 /NCGR_PEP_ID=MMETSP0447-20121125/69_1 /TAXON_ID=0 /ORGANISM="Stygamoeba regulata, Strain BSH-02190019" /LENGTH=73 /DNA_ID=CAMNT_0019129561 /DNA_START=51 /DNA_END=272 /DNA_ORIENTATION=+
MDKQAKKPKEATGEASPHTPENYDTLWDDEVREAKEVSGSVKRLDFLAEFRKAILFSLIVSVVYILYRRYLLD